MHKIGREEKSGINIWKSLFRDGRKKSSKHKHLSALPQGKKYREAPKI
jgi:hypothetical protein